MENPPFEDGDFPASYVCLPEGSGYVWIAQYPQKATRNPQPRPHWGFVRLQSLEVLQEKNHKSQVEDE